MPAPISGYEAVRKSIETLVRRDGPQYGAEDSRVAGQCQESKGMFFVFFVFLLCEIQKSSHYLLKFCCFPLLPLSLMNLNNIHSFVSTKTDSKKQNYKTI